jgi:hypothetical protein
VSENRVLRRIFGPKRFEIIGDWKRLLNEEIHNLYFSPNESSVNRSRRMRWIEPPLTQHHYTLS